MTITIEETDTRIDIVDDTLYETSQPAMCESEWTDGTRCENKADYVTKVSCCLAVLLICEDCLFLFHEYSKAHNGEHFHCNFCDKGFTLRPGHLIVNGRVS